MIINAWYLWWLDIDWPQNDLIRLKLRYNSQHIDCETVYLFLHTPSDEHNTHMKVFHSRYRKIVLPVNRSKVSTITTHQLWTRFTKIMGGTVDRVVVSLDCHLEYPVSIIGSDRKQTASFNSCLLMQMWSKHHDHDHSPSTTAYAFRKYVSYIISMMFPFGSHTEPLDWRLLGIKYNQPWCHIHLYLHIILCGHA